MHEMSIAYDLIEQVLNIAEENKAVKVTEVEIDAGVLRQIIPEMIHTAWQSVIADTIADGAKLIVNQVIAKAKCRNCGYEYEPTPDCFVCQQCNKADAEILQGSEIILKSIICEN